MVDSIVLHIFDKDEHHQQAMTNNPFLLMRHTKTFIVYMRPLVSLATLLLDASRQQEPEDKKNVYVLWCNETFDLIRNTGKATEILETDKTSKVTFKFNCVS